MRAGAALAGALLAAAAPLAAHAATEGGLELDAAPIDTHNFVSLQRGAGLYVNYCIGCHSLQYLRYARAAEDLGIDEDTAQRSLAFGGELFAPMVSAMDEEQAKEWFSQAAPPDLTLSARARGADWLYTYLRTFYRDPSRPSGWNNVVFANVAMPHALHSLQGSAVLEDDGTMRMIAPGSMAASEYDIAVADLVNFLVYAAEPSREARLRTGYAVMIVLSFLLVLTYLLYREYWRDIK